MQSLISRTKNDFQIIGTSETRLEKTQQTATYIQLENYSIEHVPTESANEGVLLCDFNDEYLRPLSEKLISETKVVMLLGDFNIDLLKYDSNKNISDFLNIIHSANLCPNITLLLD